MVGFGSRTGVFHLLHQTGQEHGVEGEVVVQGGDGGHAHLSRQEDFRMEDL